MFNALHPGPVNDTPSPTQLAAHLDDNDGQGISNKVGPDIESTQDPTPHFSSATAGSNPDADTATAPCTDEEEPGSSLWLVPEVTPDDDHLNNRSQECSSVEDRNEPDENQEPESEDQPADGSSSSPASTGAFTPDPSAEVPEIPHRSDMKGQSDDDNGQSAQKPGTVPDSPVPPHSPKAPVMADAGEVPKKEATLETGLAEPEGPLELIKRLHREDTSDTAVTTMTAEESAQEPDDAPTAAKRKTRLDLAVSALIAMGLTPEQAEKAANIKLVVGERQRKLPRWSPSTGPAMRAFFEGRTDDQLRADTAKHIRNDGGQLGPLGVYRKILVDAGVDPDAAERGAAVIAEHVARRLLAIRLHVTSVLNELLIRELVAKGIDPAKGRYLVVR